MPRWTLLLSVAAAVLWSPALGETAEEPVQLFMVDGALLTHPVSVFVNHDIHEGMHPKLKLIGTHLLAGQEPTVREDIDHMALARHQKWVEMVEGQETSFTGTLLLYDLRRFPVPPYKAMARITPILTWEEGPDGAKQQHSAIGSRSIYLGNRPGAFLWTGLLVVGLVATIGWMSYKKGGGGAPLFRGLDGRLSLSRIQIGAWTVAVGTLVCGYGLMRLEIPEMPESIVVLMGLSLATGGISYVRAREHSPDTQGQPTAPIPPDNPIPEPGFSDLLYDSGSDRRDGKVSIARAQMVFWTGLMLALFFTKSLVDGVLWDVPWEMVTLMGMSQAGYLAPKIAPPKGASGQGGQQ